MNCPNCNCGNAKVEPCCWSCGFDFGGEDTATALQQERSTNQNKVCDEILEIMQAYRAQEASSEGVDAPWGLEHMKDVWRLFKGWEQLLKAPNDP